MMFSRDNGIVDAVAMRKQAKINPRLQQFLFYCT